MKSQEKNIYLGALMIACVLLAYTYLNSFKSTQVAYDPAPTQHWIKSGTGAAVLRTLPTKVIHIKLVPASATGTLDISGLGLTTIIDVQISAKRNTSDPTLSPQVSKTAETTSSIGWNLTQANTAVVSILGISVLSGAPLISSTDLSSIELTIQITGY